jgi:hypothetical protein
MKKIPGKKKNRGVVLVFVLAVILAMSTLVLLFQARTRSHIDALTAFSSSFEMEYISEVGIEIGKEIIRMQLERESGSLSTDRNWPREKTYELDGMQIEVRVEDENSKINPNRIFGEKQGDLNTVLQNLFNNFFTVRGYPDTLRDSLLDWIDGDDIPRQNGAESFYYKSELLPYTPSNCPINNVEEILLVKDFTEEILFGKKEEKEEGEEGEELYGEDKKGLADFISMVSDGKINVNRCSPEILSGMGFTVANVERIVSERELRPLEERFLTGVNREAFIRNRSIISFKSNYYCIFSKVTDEEGRERIIRAYIYRDDKKTSVLRWIIT